MTESLVYPIFQIIDIAEVNSLSLIDYETSLNDYFSDNNNPKFYQQYFKWFDYIKFKKTNTSFLKDFDKWFHNFFF
ncbi:MAG: hypothetical protein JSV62_11300 [Promethearchaeota archaeon]|nr:MAG: hypothetical protein JSV62_11300 [Candidatus Lokiarchaeota archaeon]